MDFQVVPVAFTEGLDTRTQRKLVVPGKWDDLLNLTLSRDGTPQTRPGHAAYASGSGSGLVQRNDELLCVSDHRLFSVNQTQPSAVQRAGQVEHFFVEKTEVASSPSFCVEPDCAYGDGYTAYAWVERIYTAAGAALTCNFRCAIVEEASGAQVVSNRLVATAATPNSIICPRVVFSGGAFYFTYLLAVGAGPTGGSIFCVVAETSSPATAFAAPVIIVTGAVHQENYDACEFNGAPLVAYVFAAQSVGVAALARVGNVPSISASTTAITQAQVNAASIRAITVAPFDSAFAGVFVIHTAGGTAAAGAVGAVINAAITVTTAATNIDAATPPVGGPCHITAVSFSGVPGASMFVLTDQISSYGTADFRPIRSTQVLNTLVVATGPTTIGNSSTFRINAVEASGPQGPFLCGKAFWNAADSHTYVPAVVLENYSGVLGNTATANAQCSFFLLDASMGLTTLAYPVASALYGKVGVYNGTPNALSVDALCSTPLIGGTGGAGRRVAVVEAGTLQERQAINFTPLAISALTLTDNATRSPASEQLVESTYVAGGAMMSYDGASVTEHGFPLFPEGVSVRVAATGAGSVTPGVHQLVAVYEWMDVAGNRHQSAPSPAVQFTVVNATDEMEVIVPTLLLSSKSNVTISLYMTLAAGLTFYRMYPSPAPIQNVTTASTVAVVTGGYVVDDGVLAGCELLYTQPDQAPTTLPNFPPGPASFLAVSQNRVWWLKGDEPNGYGYSSAPIPNTGLRFHPSLGGTTPADGGKPVAIAPMDEKSIIFCERRIYVVYGTGPNAAGDFNNFSIPQDIQSDVGCSDARSILGEVPGGIMFKSAKGWYMLQRDLSVKYIGAGVARFDSLEVLSATVLEDTQECRFLTSGTADGNLNPVLVYSYLQDQWSYFVWSQDEGYAPACGAWWPGAHNGLGNFVTVSVLNNLNADTAGVYVDAISGQTPIGISTKARTGWLHLSKLEGFQRVRWLYLSATADGAPDSTLVVRVSYNDAYNVANAGAYTFSTLLGSDFTGVANQSVDVRHKLRKMKCKSIAFEFSESGAIDGTRTTGIQALALELGTKKGVNRLRAEQTVG